MRHAAIIFVFLSIVTSCAPPPPIDEDTLRDFRTVMQMRADRFASAAYLIDLRVDDNGKKFSVVTELFFSGDSVGFYGRGYLGKGAFKGKIIDDVVTIYFDRSDEYFTGSLNEAASELDCAGPGEVLLEVLSLLKGRGDTARSIGYTYLSESDMKSPSGRFERTVRLRKDGYPETEKYIDSLCGDSIVFEYGSFGREYPFYKVMNMLYYNERFNFRARGFVREQKYNIAIKPKKFMVDIPLSAVRLDAI